MQDKAAQMAMKNGNMDGGEEEEDVIACAAQHLSMAHYIEICSIVDRIPVFAADADIANCNTEAEVSFIISLICCFNRGCVILTENVFCPPFKCK